MTGWKATAVLAALAAGLFFAGAPSTAAAAAGCASPAAGSGFHQKTVSQPILPLEPLPADASSVPTWSGSFTTAGTNYPYTMVGTDPNAGSATTHVEVEIVPLRLDFAGNGCVLQQPGLASDIESSPLFTPTRLLTGSTQYVDDIQRASFWSVVGTTSPGYHLLLDPTDVPAVTLHVPASQGITVYDPTTDRVEGVVDGKWLFVQLSSLINSLHISPNVLAAFVPYNTFVTDGNPTACVTTGCGFYTGFHAAILSNAKPHSINTFVMATYPDFGDALPPQYHIGASVLSHEIIEWAMDPFDHAARVQGQSTFFGNTVPAWSSPHFGAGSVCTTVLEAADPLEDGILVVVPAGGSSALYLLADAAYLPWFARESTSSAIFGLYDEAGVFNSYSTAC